MRIIETDLYDIPEDNLDQTKVELADSIIQNIYPLFDEIYFNFLKKEKNIENSIKEKKEFIHTEKTVMEELVKRYGRKKKVRKLLERISKIIESGLTHDSSVKNQTIVILRIIDKLSEEKLDHHLNESIQLLSKRFAR